MKAVLVIGAGGIGGLLVDLVARAIAESGFNDQIAPVSLTIMDGDTVEERNLPHQPFTADDVGTPKVEALVRQLRDTGITEDRRVALIAAAEDFTSDTDLSEYDLVVVAVDREEPRNLVHANAEQWLDLRARGDGFVMCSHETDPRVFEALPKLPEGESASCQLEDAIEMGNIQFGFAEAASHGAQWVIQWLRESQLPPNRMATIHMGDLPLPEFLEEEVE